MSESDTPRPVAIIGAGLDLGAGRRGVDMGPSAIRYAELEARIRELGHEVGDWGDIVSPVPEATEVGDPTARYLAPILHACERVAGLVAEATRARARAARARRRPLDRDGDARRHGEGPRRRARRSGSTRTATSTGRERRRAATCTACRSRPRSASRATRSCPTPARRRRSTRAALVGIRSLDPGERALIARARRQGLHDERDRPARRRAGDDARRSTFLRGAPFVHVSLDLDAVDPMFAPGVGTPVRGGLSYREAHLALELVAESGLARLARARRGEPDPRPRERDRPARRRARRERARRPHPLAASEPLSSPFPDGS